MTSAPGVLVGATGRRYQFRKLFQERPDVGRVWLATSGPDRFVLKDVPMNIFSNFNNKLRPKIPESRYIRLPTDTIPGERVFVYKFLTDDFLSLVRKQLPMRARKQILKDSLRGIADLHDREIVHLDIKPDNIMANCETSGDETLVEQVQVTDIENVAYLPRGRNIKDMLAGNENWRSPEAHYMGELNKPTDMFSFGAVCIYAMLGREIFAEDKDFKFHVSQGVNPEFIRLQRQLSYFGDQDGVDGLLKHISDDYFHCQLVPMLWSERFDPRIPYKPFSEWPDSGNDAFKDLIRGLMNMDPKKRITARQALKHQWLIDV